jgi:hypothetical protein
MATTGINWLLSLHFINVSITLGPKKSVKAVIMMTVSMNFIVEYRTVFYLCIYCVRSRISIAARRSTGLNTLYVVSNAHLVSVMTLLRSRCGLINRFDADASVSRERVWVCAFVAGIDDRMDVRAWV